MIVEIGIVGSQVVWYLRTRKAHVAAKEAGLTYEEYVESSKDISCTVSDRSVEHRYDPSIRATTEKCSSTLPV